MILTLYDIIDLNMDEKIQSSMHNKTYRLENQNDQMKTKGKYINLKRKRFINKRKYSLNAHAAS